MTILTAKYITITLLGFLLPSELVEKLDEMSKPVTQGNLQAGSQRHNEQSKRHVEMG